MVSGRSLPVRCVPGTNQGADTARMAFGCGRRAARARNPPLQTLSSMAFMGEPWPTNTTGMRSDGPPRWPSLLTHSLPTAGLPTPAGASLSLLGARLRVGCVGLRGFSHGLLRTPHGLRPDRCRRGVLLELDHARHER